MEAKVCCTCKIEKSDDDFYRRTDTGKLKSDCKICYNKKVDERKKRDPKRAKAIARKAGMRYYNNKHRNPKIRLSFPPASVEDRAYLAGFFDGEGSVGIQERNGALSFTISIVNSDFPAMELAQRHYGGSIYSRKTYVNKPIRHWQVTGEYAADFARDILSFSRGKRPQLELFLDLRAKYGINGDGTGRRGIKLTSEAIAERQAFVDHLKALKRPITTENK